MGQEEYFSIIRVRSGWQEKGRIEPGRPRENRGRAEGALGSEESWEEVEPLANPGLDRTVLLRAAPDS
jgi:hypothetical protein